MCEREYGGGMLDETVTELIGIERRRGEEGEESKEDKKNTGDGGD